MRTTTILGRVCSLMLVMAFFVGTAFAQRTVTLTLNTATIPDTTNTMDFIEVRGAVDAGSGFEAPFTLVDGSVIDWSDQSTLEPVNIGGDYWQISFQMDNDKTLQYKFYSQQTENAGLNGWEADPNPTLAPGTDDFVAPVHFFEQGFDRGPYDWRPYDVMQDMIAVHYRVFGCTDGALNSGYNPADPAVSIAVRGDDLGGDSPLDWGANNLVLSQESDINGEVGFDLWSGTAYYPATAAGQTQNYKFVVANGENVGWEEGDNRNFTIPASDTTLYWDYFNRQGSPASCGTQPVDGSLIFTVDLSPLEAIGMFDKARGDTLELRGTINGWDCDNPDDCLLFDVPGLSLFENEIPVSLIPGTTQNYKFFLNYNDDTFRAAFNGQEPPSGWEEPLSTAGSDRQFDYDGAIAQDLGVQRFNDILAGNVIPGGVTSEVTFQVNMMPATNPNNPEVFDPANDSVFVDLTQDPIWAFTQGIPRNAAGDGFAIDTDFVLTDPDGDMVYTGTFTVNGPTYSAVQYLYAFGGVDTQFTEPGGGLGNPGRRRLRFIPPNADGTFPAGRVLPVEQFEPESIALPGEENPATAVTIEQIGSEVPTQVTLSTNYPNPFNPTTTFEYSIDATQDVKVRVYDMLGRVVATLVDGTQQAGRYQVNFDARDLASGTYLYRIETPTTVIGRKMLLIK